jgi:hypothetical protein
MFNFRSRFLQLVGLAAAREVVRRVERLVISQGRELVYVGEQPRPDFLRVARGDLAADFQQDRNLRLRDLSHMVCQSRSSDPFMTLSTEGIRGLLEPVQSGVDPLSPPMDNKGVSIRSFGGAGLSPDLAPPLPGPCEAAAASVLDAFSAAVRAELEDGTRGGRVTRMVLQGRHPQTVYFGKWKSPIFAKVYNKLASLKPQRKLYMLDVWQNNGWDGTGKVWRWEYTFTGDFLKSVYIGDDRVDLRDFDTFLAYIPALWHYVTHKWLRQVVDEIDDDKETQRMLTTDYWTAVQAAWQSPIGITRDNSRYLRIKSEADAARKIDELEKQAVGCMTTAMAIKARSQSLRVEPDLRPTLDYDVDTGEVLHVKQLTIKENAIEGISARVNDDFEREVYHRQRMIGVDDLSDSALTSLYRAERILEGGGS